MSETNSPQPDEADARPSRSQPESTPVSAPGRGASRRTVLSAVAGALGAVGVAACTTSAPVARSATGPTVSPPATGLGSPAAPSAAAPAPSASSTTTAAVLATSGPDLRAGATGGARVALTFHGAGPGALTTRVIEIARAHQAHLTVFAVGQWLAAAPELGRAILSGGHDLGNHTWSHQPMRRLSRAQADVEVSRGAAAVAQVRGSAGSLFRPSGTPSSTATIRAAALASGYHRCISYDVDPSDYLDPGATAVRERTLSAVRDGSIVSLHLGHAGTVAALPGILDGLHQRGLTAVTVTELLTGR